LIVGDDGANFLDEGRARGFNGHSRQHPAGPVAYDARNRARLLRECRV
jgi:hypothetical protein